MFPKKSPSNSGGGLAESEVEIYLKTSGYKILDRNWKTKACEVDIVAKRAGCIYFVEVKYRSSRDQGEGFDYITKSKLKQMQFAARYYVAVHKWPGEYVLSAASVSGPDFDIEFIEEI